MPFRKLQDLEKFSSGKIVYTYLRTNPDTGISEAYDSDQQAKLPGVEMTDLSATLKAGVSLQQVNCKLVNGSNAVANLNAAIDKASKDFKTSVKPSEGDDDHAE